MSYIKKKKSKNEKTRLFPIDDMRACCGMTAEPVVLSLPTAAVHRNRGKYRRHPNADYTVDIKKARRPTIVYRSVAVWERGRGSSSGAVVLSGSLFIVLCSCVRIGFCFFFSDRFSFCQFVRVGSVRFVTCFHYRFRFSLFISVSKSNDFPVYARPNVYDNGTCFFFSDYPTNV